MSNSTTPNSDFVEEALRVVKLAEDNGIKLRIMGAVAFRIHCPKFQKLYEKLGRELSDLDFVGYKKKIKDTIKFIERIGYKSNPNTLLLRRVLGRYKWHDQINNRYLDIFFDKLEMCHTIDFRKRLEIDRPTITLADLLLEKLQVVRLTEKDAIDSIIMLREHDTGQSDNETINKEYISSLFSNDWGFYYTATTNLRKIRDNFLPTYSILSDKDKENVKTKINKLLDDFESSPKSSNWKKRAAIGTSKKWYREVEDVEG